MERRRRHVLVAVVAIGALLRVCGLWFGLPRAADPAAQPAKPMDHTDFDLTWRKLVTREFVNYALRGIRGDDMHGGHRRVSRQALLL